VANINSKSRGASTNYCILFISKKPSKYLIDFCKTFENDSNVYIVTQENADSKNLLHVDKENFFREYHCKDYRIELSKSLIMIANSPIIDKYDYFFSIEDDVFIRSSQDIVNLANDFSSVKSHLIISNRLFSPTNQWYLDWAPEIKNSNILKIMYKKCASVSPITRYSRDILLEVNNIYLAENKVYFHEIVYPLVCQKNKWGIQKINRRKYKMLMTLYDKDESILDLNDAISSIYNFIHPVKYGGIL